MIRGASADVLSARVLLTTQGVDRNHVASVQTGPVRPPLAGEGRLKLTHRIKDYMMSGTSTTSNDPQWYYAANGETIGPVSLNSLIELLPTIGGQRALVYGPGMVDWVEASQVSELRAAWQRSRAVAAAPALPPAAPKTSTADVIDYDIFGEEMQYVVVTLDPDETVIAEAGAMMFMTPDIKMETVFGDPSAQSGFFGKLKAAGKRLLTGESMFITTFRNQGTTRQEVAFASPYPGRVIPINLEALGGELICQKDSFLCAAKGIQIGVAFQKKFGVGLFGGEGFIMQRLLGDGVAMIHAGGTLLRRTLAEGETLRVDTGCLVALVPTVKYDIQFVGGVKNTLFGGEGLFFATLTGPGDVWLQSLPFSRLAGRVIAAAGPAGSKDEGSLLGGLLTGDRS